MSSPQKHQFQDVPIDDLSRVIRVLEPTKHSITIGNWVLFAFAFLMVELFLTSIGGSSLGHLFKSLRLDQGEGFFNLGVVIPAILYAVALATLGYWVPRSDFRVWWPEFSAGDKSELVRSMARWYSIAISVDLVIGIFLQRPFTQFLYFVGVAVFAGMLVHRLKRVCLLQPSFSSKCFFLVFGLVVAVFFEFGAWNIRKPEEPFPELCILARLVLWFATAPISFLWGSLSKTPTWIGIRLIPPVSPGKNYFHFDLREFLLPNVRLKFAPELRETSMTYAQISSSNYRQVDFINNPDRFLDQGAFLVLIVDSGRLSGSVSIGDSAHLVTGRANWSLGLRKNAIQSKVVSGESLDIVNNFLSQATIVPRINGLISSQVGKFINRQVEENKLLGLDNEQAVLFARANLTASNPDIDWSSFYGADEIAKIPEYFSVTKRFETLKQGLDDLSNRKQNGKLSLLKINAGDGYFIRFQDHVVPELTLGNEHLASELRFLLSQLVLHAKVTVSFTEEFERILSSSNEKLGEFSTKVVDEVNKLQLSAVEDHIAAIRKDSMDEREHNRKSQHEIKRETLRANAKLIKAAIENAPGLSSSLEGKRLLEQAAGLIDKGVDDLSPSSDELKAEKPFVFSIDGSQNGG